MMCELQLSIKGLKGLKRSGQILIIRPQNLFALDNYLYEKPLLKNPLQ
jgi:hypothetical protein